MKDKILGVLNGRQWQTACIDTDKILFTAEVRDACKANMCGMYNKTWTCPPGVGEVEQLNAKCLKYKNAFVFTTVNKLEDSFDIEGMTEARVKHESITRDIFEKLENDDILILGAGGCSLCPKCAYPAKPCRMPDKTIVSMEAAGINVVNLAPKCGINYINGENTVTYFSAVLFN